MNKISLKNFRCFLDVQDVRIAPLTLLVGENSSGKTSFMAMIRALWDVAYGHKVPDFKEEPFDLGSFDEIAHHRGARGSRAETIVAEFEWTHKIPSDVRERFDTTDPLRLSVTFEKRAEAPIRFSGGSRVASYGSRNISEGRTGEPPLAPAVAHGNILMNI